MKKTHFITIFFELLLIAWITIIASEPDGVPKTFVSSQKLFANPERGWIVHRYSHELGDLAGLRDGNQSVSLVLIKIDLSNYVEKALIGKEKMNEIREALNQCRKHGLKVVLRSAYGWEQVPFPDPQDINTISAHVMNIKQIYNDYEDLIIAVEMGMFGPWGEMHSSKHSTNNVRPNYPIKTDALKVVHKAYMSALPRSRSVLVRRPHYIREIFKDDKPLTRREAYGKTGKARTGYHNDGYLNSKTDGGTFSHKWTRDQELDYINQLTRFTFFGGETYGEPNDTYNNAKNALIESKRQHMTYLHKDWYPPIYEAWGTTVQDEFIRRLGYRFELVNLSYSQKVAPGNILNIHLTLKNRGFAAMHLKRPVILILDNGKKGSQRINYPLTLNADLRAWTPEAGTISISCKFPIPANITEGTWQLLLALPDPSQQLKDDARYAVRFANENVWNSDGTNLLTEKIVIVAGAPAAHS